MPSAILHAQAQKFLKNRPELRPGYTVRVHERIHEGEKDRVQIFEGLIIGVHAGHTPMDTTFIVRRIASGIGVERGFSLHSPLLEKRAFNGKTPVVLELTSFQLEALDIPLAPKLA